MYPLSPHSVNAFQYKLDDLTKSLFFGLLCEEPLTDSLNNPAEVEIADIYTTASLHQLGDIDLEHQEVNAAWHTVEEPMLNIVWD